jgi:hypothetical protein
MYPPAHCPGALYPLYHVRGAAYGCREEVPGLVREASTHELDVRQDMGLHGDTRMGSVSRFAGVVAAFFEEGV